MSDNPLWSWSVNAWSLPGVESVLLDLQDHFGADINMLLACCWLAAERRNLPPELVRQALKQTQPWLRDCIRPLRGVRRFLSGSAQFSGLKERVKALELEAEQLQLAALHDLLKDCPKAQSKNAARTFQALAEANIGCYCEASAGFAWPDVAENVLLLIKRLDA